MQRRRRVLQEIGVRFGRWIYLANTEFEIGVDDKAKAMEEA